MELKFYLLNEMEFNKLNKFKSDMILNVDIPKANEKIWTLGISTIRDRAIQMLLYITINPIVEPLGDTLSFGFRLGREAIHAIAHLANRLSYRRRGRQNLPRNLTFTAKYKSSGNRSTNYFNTKTIINADIKSYFDKISHDWLINNFPRYKHILINMLQASKIHHKTSEIKHNTGEEISQGGIISSMLMNWTLDELKLFVHNTLRNTLSSSGPLFYSWREDEIFRVYRNFRWFKP